MDETERILVVEDDEDVRTTIEVILKSKGYTVDVAANGSEAIRKAQNAVYNLILIDIRLPDMDGGELLTRIKGRRKLLRKIILTGYPTLKGAIAAVNKKADAYLIKPVEIDKLLDTISTQLKLQEAEKTYSEQNVAEFIESRLREKTKK